MGYSCQSVLAAVQKQQNKIRYFGSHQCARLTYPSLSKMSYNLIGIPWRAQFMEKTPSSSKRFDTFLLLSVEALKLLSNSSRPHCFREKIWIKIGWWSWMALINITYCFLLATIFFMCKFFYFILGSPQTFNISRSRKDTWIFIQIFRNFGVLFSFQLKIAIQYHTNSLVTLLVMLRTGLNTN